MRGVGAKTYETYKAKYGKEPTSYALYAAEGTRVIIEAVKRAAAGDREGQDVAEKREALRKAIASTKNFEGINGKWSFDENGDVDYDTMSGFKAVKDSGPIGCKVRLRDHPRVRPAEGVGPRWPPRSLNVVIHGLPP